MHTELYCTKLKDLNRTDAIRAIHQAWLQLSAHGERVEADGVVLDNRPAILALGKCLKQAGHFAFAGAEYDASRDPEA